MPLVRTSPRGHIVGSIGKHVVINVGVSHTLKEETVIEEEREGNHDNKTDGQTVKNGVARQGPEGSHQSRRLRV